MNEHGAAAPGDAWPRIVIDLDNIIVEAVLALEAVAILIVAAPDWHVVMAFGGILRPRIARLDRAHRQERSRSNVSIGSPPHLHWMKNPARRSTVALEFVGLDSATSERNRHELAACDQPATARISGTGMDLDRRKRSITQACPVSPWKNVASHPLAQLPLALLPANALFRQVLHDRDVGSRSCLGPLSKIRF